MKLKHVLFSGLLLSAGLTACTNEELIDVQTPSVNTEDGIALGEGITIVGTKGNIGTRAEFADDFQKALWESDDVIGAAWYNMITGFTPAGVPNANQPFQISGSNVFASNTWFKFDKQVGEDMSSAQFKSEANLMAGAYVLYYPYDDAIKTSAGFDGIPVAMEYNQTMDCKAGNELAAVNENIFAYSIQPFVNGGAQTTTFKLNQLNNVFAIRFMVTKPDLMILEKPVGIKKVIIKANNGTSSVLTAAGKVSVPTLTAYEEGKYGEAKFVAGTDAADYADHDQLILDVENADNNYAITAVGEAGATQKPFYLAALPFHAGMTELTVQILTDDNKVYGTTYTSGDLFDKVKERAVLEGQQINLNVILDELQDQGLIYNAEQFNEQWQAVLDGTKEDALQIADGLDLGGVDLAIDKNVTVTIEGKALKGVKSLDLSDGSLVINNEGVEVSGDVTVGSNVASVSGTGALSVDGTLTVRGGETSKMNLTVAKVGELVIEKSGIIALTGADNKVALNDVTNEGQLTLKTIAIAKDATVANTGTITIGDATVVNNGTIVNDGTFTIGNYTFANKGEFEQNKMISAGNTGKFVNNGTLTVNATTSLNIENAAADATQGLTAGIINVEEGGALNATTNKTVTNASTINVNGGALNENAASTLIQNATAARINVGEKGAIKFNGTTGVTGGFVINEGTATGACNVLAETATTAEELATATATYIFVSGDMEITSLPENKNFYLTGGTITLGNNITVNKSSVIVTGDVTIAAKGETATLTLFNYDQNAWGYGANANNVVDGGKLTIAKGVTLSATTTTNLIKVNGGQIVCNGTIDSEKVTVVEKF